MKNLMYKELKLLFTPYNIIFFCLAILIMIPNYPTIIGIAFALQTLNLHFSLAVSNKDNDFTALLPVSKKDIVASRILSVVLLQLAQIVFAIPFAIVRNIILNGIGVQVGLIPNFTFFGYALIGYAIFNIFFLPGFFKTGYKYGKPFLIALVFYVVFIVAFEVLIGVVPALYANFATLAVSTFVYQIPFLVFGIILYAILNLLTVKLSVKNYEKVNL